jgi:hypothetical protein
MENNIDLSEVNSIDRNHIESRLENQETPNDSFIENEDWDSYELSKRFTGLYTITLDSAVRSPPSMIYIPTEALLNEIILSSSTDD